jgi:hypothetical protein
MSKDDHFIIAIRDNKNRLLDFERFKLKTAKGSYKSFLKFVNCYKIEQYEKGYNTYKEIEKPYKIVVTYQEYDPAKETIIFEKTYDSFLKDLKEYK